MVKAVPVPLGPPIPQPPARKHSPSKKPKNHKQKSLARAKSSYGAEPVSPYPVMKVSCQIVQSYLVQFFLFGLRWDFVLFVFTIEILRCMDSVGLCWTRVGLGSNIPNHYLTSKRCKTNSLTLDSVGPSPTSQITISRLQILDSPRLGFYKIRKESNAGDGPSHHQHCTGDPLS